jgi:hypothetical protein
MNESQTDFHIEEYKSLRDEILLYTRREALVVFYVVLVNGGVLSWVLSSLNSGSQFNGPVVVGSLVPIFFTLVGWRYYRVNDNATERIAAYLLKLEDALAAKDYGWEHSIRREGLKQRLGHFFIGNMIFVVLLLISLYSCFVVFAKVYF